MLGLGLCESVKAFFFFKLKVIFLCEIAFTVSSTYVLI